MSENKIYDVNKKRNQTKFKIRLTVLYSSEENKEWTQTTNYDLQIIVKKQNWKEYIIDYIKILNEHTEVAYSNTNTDKHEHDQHEHNHE